MSVAALLFRKPQPVSAGTATAGADPRTAIIDIGSNSVRLVVYQGPARIPAVLFNEKVMAGLGRGLAATGSIDPSALAMARTALARFAAVAREMDVASLRTIATAAVRDAANGGELIAAAEALGLDVEILTGEQEARGAARGSCPRSPTRRHRRRSGRGQPGARPGPRRPDRGPRLVPAGRAADRRGARAAGQGVRTDGDADDPRRGLDRARRRPSAVPRRRVVARIGAARDEPDRLSVAGDPPISDAVDDDRALGRTIAHMASRG